MKKKVKKWMPSVTFGIPKIVEEVVPEYRPSSVHPRHQDCIDLQIEMRTEHYYVKIPFAQDIHKRTSDKRLRQAINRRDPFIRPKELSIRPYTLSQDARKRAVKALEDAPYVQNWNFVTKRHNHTNLTERLAKANMRRAKNV